MAKRKEKDHGYDDGSYVIKKGRKFSVFAFILCLLIAFVIWLYAAGKANAEQQEVDTAAKETVCADVCTDLSDAFLV